MAADPLVGMDIRAQSTGPKPGFDSGSSLRQTQRSAPLCNTESVSTEMGKPEQYHEPFRFPGCEPYSTIRDFSTATRGAVAMDASEQAVTRDFTIEIVRYAKTDLLMAFSNELPGLLVAARGEEQLDQRLIGAVRELLEAQGATNICVSLKSEPSDLPSDFIPSRFRAHASLQLPAAQ
jgi:hypothetical protein